LSILGHLRKWGAVYSLIITAATGAILLKEYFAPPLARIELWQLDDGTALFDKTSAIYLSQEATRLPDLYSASLTYRNTGDVTVPNVTDRRRVSNADAIVAIKAVSETVDSSQVKASIQRGVLAVDIDFLKPTESVTVTIFSRVPVKLSGEFRMRNAEAKIVDPEKQLKRVARQSYVLLAIMFVLVSFQSFALYRATTKRPNVIDDGSC
jgi:hypothetical protein